MKKARVYTEREAEDFLKRNGFYITKTIFVDKEDDISSALLEFSTRVVMKIAGKNIVHKAKIGGVKTDIYDYNGAVKAFKELKKIKGFQGALIQGQIKGDEYLLGLKKTDDFGYVVAFAKGGSKVEKARDVSFRVCGVDGVGEIIKDVKAAKNLTGEQVDSVEKVLKKLCKLVRKHKDIKALDINPLIFEGHKAVIVDSQIVFD